MAASINVHPAAHQIRFAERDYHLKMEADVWPPEQLPLLDYPAPQTKENGWNGSAWSIDSDHSALVRDLQSDSGRLREYVVRFPSAPIFGIQREQDYQYKLNPLHYHGLRVFFAQQSRSEPCRRIYLLINGLNETDYLTLYYDIAQFLLAKEPGACCILCTLPGHLARYPLVGRFAEMPLSRFISDPGELLRQYLRFMTEMRWLLSVIVPVANYPVMPGLDLVAPATSQGEGRADIDTVARAIYQSWETTYEGCLTIRGTSRRDAAKVTLEAVRSSCETLRKLLLWEAGSLNPRSSTIPSPRLHLVGYSLGGYMAQSVFFTWPFAISGCTTICSGGALSDLQPFKITHPEEWRSIINGVKYEVESGMLEGRITVNEETKEVAGLPVGDFSALYRIFNDVFLQERHGSYRARVAEFAPRLLFVLGGRDPIVNTHAVLDSGSQSGINLVQVTDLDHFVALDQSEWRRFWLPAVIRLLSDFSSHAEESHNRSVLLNLWDIDRRRPIRRPPKPGSPNRDGRKAKSEGEPLDSSSFRSCIDKIVSHLEKGGHLFILRNRLPIILMGDQVLQKRGTVPHYEDELIRRYFEWMIELESRLLARKEHVTVVLPKSLSGWFVKSGPLLSAKTEPSSKPVPATEDLADIWKNFERKWGRSRAVYYFDAEKRYSGELEEQLKERTLTDPAFPLVNTLPNIWLSCDGSALGSFGGDGETRGSAWSALRHAALRLSEGDPGYKKILEGTLNSGQLMAVRMPSTFGNSLYFGEILASVDSVGEKIIHSGLVLEKTSAEVGKSRKRNTKR